jgi:hypothetical protein
VFCSVVANCWSWVVVYCRLAESVVVFVVLVFEDVSEWYVAWRFELA